MAQINIVQGLVRGKLGDGFGDPYNNKTYYKVLNTRHLVEDDIRTALIKKYGFIGGVSMRTVNMIYNMYMASNCKSMDEKNYWSAVDKSFDITTADVYNLAKIAYKHTDLKITDATVSAGGSGVTVKIKNDTKTKQNKTSSLILFAYSKDGECIGQSYSAANNAYYDEKNKCFVVPKDKRFRWQKAEGGEFAYSTEMVADLQLIRPIDEEVFIVAYNVEVGNYKWIFSDGSEVVISDNALTQL